MSELVLKDSIEEKLEQIYQEMERDYDKVASELQFSCAGCPDNCCDSYFQHHTYIEWVYLWDGIEKLSPELQKKIQDDASSYVIEAEKKIGSGERPLIMCPLNENGLCMVYTHRLMVCRTHGVPAALTRPDGQKLNFPGCFRCKEKVDLKQSYPVMDRTSLLRQLALLENELLFNKRHLFPRVKMTIAEMIVRGRPQLPPSCLGGECSTM